METGPKGIEQLLEMTGLDSGRLNAVLTLMELKGIIKKLPGKHTRSNGPINGGKYGKKTSCGRVSSKG